MFDRFRGGLFFGQLRLDVPRYRCPVCRSESRPLLDVEPGRISGCLARLLALLAAVAPYPLAARLANLLLGVTISPMGVWGVAQRLGQAAASYSEALSRYHGDSRSEGAPADQAPGKLVASVDGCALDMQVHTHRRRRTGVEPLPPLPPVEQGHFREVKTGVLLLPEEPVETSHSVVRRILVSCLGDADIIFQHLYAQLRELGWLGPQTMAVIVGDGAEWIWNRAIWFIRRCEILDFWRAMEHAWAFARLLWRWIATSRSIGPPDRYRSQGRQNRAGDCPLETPASADSPIARESGIADPLLQRKLRPHAL